MRYELEDRVAELYDGDKGKAIAKEIRTDVLGGKNARVRARESNKARIGDVIWRLRREFEKVRLGTQVFDFNDSRVHVHPAANTFLYGMVSLGVEEHRSRRGFRQP
ncbi:hypothetical protein CYMTET_22161 [Cymbomonas tetramitiformis]|uniref:Uncharacterized protein n=1 Tax=Cymbomonas tetramitiformis TaxID=36881 RepID=A0AAE0G0S1_9CHLO|nr:hypothetical protein CYMTET_22161 [Cymbomonas tetramitiformis]